MEERTARFLRSLFARYYASHPPAEPRELPRREFAFMTFDGVVIRHKAFATHEELAQFMAKLGPSDAFYSSAYFEHPDEPEMRAKGWLGADLIFDIDADHLPTACKAQHDLWACLSCGRWGRGEAPARCPKCGSEELAELKWICQRCLSAAREELLKLVEVLEEDLGLDSSDMVASFSGHRGYHLRASSEDVLGMGQDERNEVVDYLMAVGLEPELLGLRPGAVLSVDQPGWRGRIARELYSLLYGATEVELRALGLRRKAAQAILSAREAILDCLEHGKPFLVPKGVGKASLRKLFLACARRAAVNVDPVVTRDTHRLIRMSGSLHGKTGLLKLDVPLEELEEVDPLSEAVAFRRGWAKVRITAQVPEVPVLELAGEEYGPFKPGEVVELPLQAAVFLMCKRVAELA